MANTRGRLPASSPMLGSSRLLSSSPGRLTSDVTVMWILRGRRGLEPRQSGSRAPALSCSPELKDAGHLHCCDPQTPQLTVLVWTLRENRKESQFPPHPDPRGWNLSFLFSFTFSLPPSARRKPAARRKTAGAVDGPCREPSEPGGSSGTSARLHPCLCPGAPSPGLPLRR